MLDTHYGFRIRQRADSQTMFGAYCPLLSMIIDYSHIDDGMYRWWYINICIPGGLPHPLESRCGKQVPGCLGGSLIIATGEESPSSPFCHHASAQCHIDTQVRRNVNHIRICKCNVHMYQYWQHARATVHTKLWEACLSTYHFMTNWFFIKLSGCPYLVGRKAH